MQTFSYTRCSLLIINPKEPNTVRKNLSNERRKTKNLQKLLRQRLFLWWETLVILPCLLICSNAGLSMPVKEGSKDSIEVVSMDMSPSFISEALEYLPEIQPEIQIVKGYLWFWCDRAMEAKISPFSNFVNTINYINMVYFLTAKLKFDYLLY
ncbi:MAG: transposase, partial [Tannerella sp.]|nr:transposase [Tannerella sp.]